MKFGSRSIKQVAASWVNELALRDAATLIGDGERYYHRNVSEVADYLFEHHGSVRILLLAGPSASGKTTTARKISALLQQKGMQAPVVSLDDFYRNTADLPLEADGRPDYETLDALDVPEIQRCFTELVETGASELPRFDFSHKRRAKRRTSIRLGAEGVLIVEGIHALNPVLVSGLGDTGFLRIYISVLTELVEGEETVLSARDCRLIRRIVRDQRHRGSPMEETLDMWESVCRGEERWIQPFAQTADAMIDSMHYYEPCIYPSFLRGAIATVPADSRYAGTAAHLNRLLDRFQALDPACTPEDSLLQEFIG